MKNKNIDATWLSNLTQDDIEDFTTIYLGKYLWHDIDTDMRSAVPVVRIFARDEWGYQNETCFSAYGYYDSPDEVDDIVIGWFNTLKSANIDTTVDGISYLQAFQRAHQLDLDELDDCIDQLTV